MSWFNNIKGQLTTLAQEVMSETAGPGDDEYVPSMHDATTLLADAQKECERLNKICADKDAEINVLRKQVAEIQNKVTDSAGGNCAVPMPTTLSSSGRTSKSPTDQSATLEDSWCWEEGENVKSENDGFSEASSGEMVNITLEEVALGRNNPSGYVKRLLPRQSPEEVMHFQKRIQQLEEENKHLNASLEELDLQHNEAIQNVLEMKTDLQIKLNALSKDYETLKKDYADKSNNSKLELAQIKKQNKILQQDLEAAALQRTELQRNNDTYAVELKNATMQLADVQALLEKKDKDNIELIERIRAINKLNEETAEQQKVLHEAELERINNELKKLKSLNNKNNSESSTTGSADKQSDDEFIVVREGDAGSSSPATPPSKEELKNKIVQLENKLSELTLENGSLSLKLQDIQIEKELSSNVLKDNLDQLEEILKEREATLAATLEELSEQRLRNDRLEEEAAALSEEKQEEDRKRSDISEQQNESLESELVALRAFKDRAQELEEKLQELTFENRRLRESAEAETEARFNSDTSLKDKTLTLTAGNDSLGLELVAAAQGECSHVTEEKPVTDLDADEELEHLVDKEKLKKLLLNVFKESLNEKTGDRVSDDDEKMFKMVYERLEQFDSLQKSLAQMSENLLEFRESKLMWQHEKKTLEADITQYVLQCDELMKNNEILLNELDNYKRNKLETISESNEENMVQLETALEECTKLNRTLEQEYAEMNDRIIELEKEKQELNGKLVEFQSINAKLVSAQSDYKLQVETLELEKCNLQSRINEWKTEEERNDEMKLSLMKAESESNSLRNQLQRLSKDHADLVNAMQIQNASLIEAHKKSDELEKLLENKEKLIRENQAENEKLQSLKTMMENKVEELQNEIKQKDEQFLKQSEEFKKVLDENNAAMKQLKNNLKEVEEELNSLNDKNNGSLNERSVLESERDRECESFEPTPNIQYREIGDLRKDQTAVNFKEAFDELKLSKEKLQTEYEELQKKFDDLWNELKALKEIDRCSCKIHDEPIVKPAKPEAEAQSSVDFQTTIDLLNHEKREMIKAIQQKHSESMQYYMEIQRLQPIIQNLQHELANKSCDKCPDLESNLAELRKVLERQNDQIKFLKEKSDILTTNLLTEQTNQKLVHHEKMELMEQNTTLRKDLERLREHLLEIEDIHTKDAMDVHRELEETKARLVAVQEELSKSNNAYTSASIRANQHAETLQAQYALVVNQRDELVAKLSSAEDRESKNQAALCNLQCALEQFQNDKENDIKVATQRIRKELQHQLERERQLQREIATLNQQLSDANQGLRAASRLTDQLEACQLTMASLREEVKSLKAQKEEVELKLSLSETSQSDKIEKNLIKSLLIGYVISSNPNDKTQILRMISSVLEFTAGEADRVGLNKQQTSWLGALLGSNNGTTSGRTSRENLVEAFVEFLEQESQPNINQSNFPNLLGVTRRSSNGSSGNGTPSPHPSIVSNNNSTNNNNKNDCGAFNVSNSNEDIKNDARSIVGSLSPTPQPIPIQPLVLNSNIIDDFAPTRNSSSILKDILSDA